MKKTVEEMKTYIKENGYTRFVCELRSAGFDLEEAVEYVYDQHTLTREDFRAKYF